MKNILTLLFALNLSFMYGQQSAIKLGEKKAFPTALGGGAYTAGNTTDNVYLVTSLDGDVNGNTPGSLAAAKRMSNVTIQFDVGGYIDYNKRFTSWSGDNVTFAFETAPAPGITVKYGGIGIYGSQFIMRHYRGRRGYGDKTTESGLKPLKVIASGKSIDHIIIDHCDLSWTMDENFAMGNASGDYQVNDFTYQYNQSSEAINYYGILIGKGGRNLSFLRNSFLHVGNRLPESTKGWHHPEYEFINNLVFDYNRATVASYGSFPDIVNNVYEALAVPPTPPLSYNRPYQGFNVPYDPVEDPPAEDGAVYDFGNIMTGTTNPKGLNNTNWGINRVSARQNPSSYMPMPASEVVSSVLYEAGATVWPDAVHTRVINEYETKTGQFNIGHEDNVGGFPVLATTSHPSGFWAAGNRVSQAFKDTHGFTDDMEKPDFFTINGIKFDNRTYSGGTYVNMVGETQNEYIGGSLSGGNNYTWWDIFRFEKARDFETYKWPMETFLINEIPQEVTSYSSQDLGGTFAITDNGNVLNLSGNSWKKASLDYKITPNTILELDFRVDGRGEIQGIGFDDDTILNTSGSPNEIFFKLFGTQGVVWDNTDFENYSAGEGWKSYTIPLGDYITGNKEYIVFMGDKDSNSDLQNSSFRNITFREASAAGESEVWLEAECATVGQGWSTVQDASTSGGEYLLPPSGAKYNTPPTNSSDFVTFDFEIEGGKYGIYARIDTPNQDDDSFWVRVNGGDWIKWNELSNSRGFSWYGVYDSDDEDSVVTLNLSDGTNTIDFAHREDGAGLDKILIRALGKVPNGIGEMAVNCAPVIPQMVSLAPTHDAYLQGSTRFNNSLLKVSPNSRVTYFKYDLSLVTGLITEAELQFTVTQDTGGGDIRVYKGNSTNWTETNLSTANRPIEGPQLGSIPSVGSTITYSIPLTAGELSGDGDLSLILKQTSGDDFSFASKENGSLSAPTLNITYQSSNTLTTQAVVVPTLDQEVIRIFPNPATNIVTVKGLEGRNSVSISDSFGRNLQSGIFNEEKVDFNLSTFASGSYFIEIIGKNNKQFTVIKK